jgi:predicted nucleic acid-binding Zn ribbon protein
MLVRDSFVGSGMLLQKVVAHSLKKVPDKQGPVLAWPLACGSAVAARTRALEYGNGVLRVEVADLGWKRELQALAPQYLAVLNRYVGESVNRIEFAVAPRK